MNRQAALSFKNVRIQKSRKGRQEESRCLSQIQMHLKHHKLLFWINICDRLAAFNKIFSYGMFRYLPCLYNKWLLKRQLFSHLCMVTGNQLAIMDFNAGRDLEQVKTM